MFVRYNRELAVKYATDWAQDRNPNYKDYEKWGGDCTNFVSQCLHEGGIPFLSWKWYIKTVVLV